MLVERNQFDHAQDGWLGVSDGEFPRLLFRPADGDDQQPDAGAVDERELGEIKNGVDAALEAFFELGDV